MIIDLTIINVSAYVFFKNQEIKYHFYIFISLVWMLSAYITTFYKVYRFTGTLKLMRLIVTQLIIFILNYFAYFGIFKENIVASSSKFNTIFCIAVFISVLKITGYYALKIYRKLGKNFRNVVFVETDDTSNRISKLFKTKKNLGYTYKGFFTNSLSKETEYLGKVNDVFKYIKNNTIHEIYATLSVLKEEQIKNLMKLANENKIALKLIPNSNELYSKNQKPEFYDDTFKVLSVKKLPFEYAENRLVKRIFDLVFSTLTILLIMSWITPILWVIIKLESKGPLFFRQEREGLNGKKFICYKFRSMRKNKLANKIHTTKNDSRITRIGKLIRKTSIDELPQFFNVFLGNMSVVGPRPHMESLAVEYQRDVDNYIERHAVKPGITGLAQVSGYRGEIKKKTDIENRVRLDIFYIENWSFLFDIKIIIKTILNVFKGEENAY